MYKSLCSVKKIISEKIEDKENFPNYGLWIFDIVSHNLIL